MKLTRAAFSITYNPQSYVCSPRSHPDCKVHIPHTTPTLPFNQPIAKSTCHTNANRSGHGSPICLGAVASISVVVSLEKGRDSLLHCLQASNNTTTRLGYLIQNCRGDIQKVIKEIVSFQFPETSSATVHRICTIKNFPITTASTPSILGHQEQKPPPITS